MNDQQKVLTSILQNAEMGTTTIREIFPSITNSALKSELRHQLSEYSRQNNLINHQMSKSHYKGKSISPFSLAMAKMGVKMNLAKDNSTCHIAEMLIQGTNMGIININKALNHSNDVSTRIKSQAEELLNNEQNYINRLKGFL